MARRLSLIAALLVMVASTLACGATTTIVQTGSSGATATSGATSTPLPPTPTATPNPGRYNGTWVDDTAGTYGTGELIISNSGPIASVQAYGICGTKCNWGSTSATVGPYSLVVSYTLGTTESAQLTMQLSGTGLKIVDVDAHFGTLNYTMHRASSLEQRAFLYAGEWVNNDPNTTGIPQVLISVVGLKLTVHGYGACSPTYCDWGTQSGTYAGDPFKALFSFSGGALTHSLSLSLLDSAGSSMQIVDVGSSSGTNTYSFHKSVIA